jgi:uncharacterized protein YbaP (TraB family)
MFRIKHNKPLTELEKFDIEFAAIMAESRAKHIRFLRDEMGVPESIMHLDIVAELDDTHMVGG